LLPESPYRLVEPFCGGAALFFSVHPQSAVLGDCNKSLIATYEAVRDDPESVIKAMDRFENSETGYYAVRAQAPENASERAARFIFLCRFSFNGLYRVNRQGEFNVPYGYKTWRSVSDPESIREASEALQPAELTCSDFDATIGVCGPGDVIYADPPYTVAHSNNGFLKYNDRIFSFEDQERLSRSLKRAAKKGAQVFLSNADHESIRKLYAGSKVFVFERFSRISSSKEFRRKTTELVIKVNE
jgi:DNA adenine methylase